METGQLQLGFCRDGPFFFFFFLLKDWMQSKRRPTEKNRPKFTMILRGLDLLRRERGVLVTHTSISSSQLRAIELVMEEGCVSE